MIKKFENFDEDFEEMDGIYQSTSKDGIQSFKNLINSSFRILKNLKDGFAVKIEGKYIEEFFDMVDNFGGNIEVDRNVPGGERVIFNGDDSLYFVLIGKKLYHTTIPIFGETHLEVYIPSL